MNTKQKIIYRGFMTVIFLACVLVITVFLLAVCPYNVIEVENANNLELDKKVYNSGEILKHRLNYCKNYDFIGTVSYQFVDGIIYTLKEKESNVPKGCKDVWVAIEIPKNVPAGEYKIKAIAEYRVNPFKTKTYTFTSESFNIKN
jgi:hypothetical protein